MRMRIGPCFYCFHPASNRKLTAGNGPGGTWDEVQEAALKKLYDPGNMKRYKAAITFLDNERTAQAVIYY